MKLIEQKYEWGGGLSSRPATKYIILHHRGGDGDAVSIHKQHLRNGWSGIGYHFYVRKDGTIYTGRPVSRIGAHCDGYNSFSVGICFEGNYEKERTMPDAQKKAGQELISYLKELFPYAEVKGHKSFVSTACPGKYFPLDEIKEGKVMKKELTSANDITWELSQMIEINDVDGFVKALDKAKRDNSPLYWGFYKIVNR